jgi:hypothetical protein
VHSLDDASNLESWTVPSGNLSTSTTYYIRVRHAGTTYGDSGWSSGVSFTTAAAFAYAYTNTEAQTFEDNADATGWDDTLRGDIDQLFSDLKSGQVNSTNVLAELDFLFLHDLPNSSDALRDLIDPTHTATTVNSPAHAANEGFTGNGSTSYVDTNYTPSSDGVNYTTNDASMFAWVRTAGTASGIYMGAYQTSGGRNYVGVRRRTDGEVWDCVPPNSDADLYGTTLSQNATGLLACNRSASSAVQIYLDGSSEGSSSLSSTGLTNESLKVCTATVNGSLISPSDGQISISGAGGSLTANQHADLYDALNRYRTAREAA